jgi:hypothetical protein
LLKARQALDGDIESLQRNGTIDGTSAGKSAYRAANDIRGQLDGVLKADPFIAAGDNAFSEHMALKDAVDEGTQLFTKGTRLPDFQRSLASKTPEEVDALRQGALSAVWDALDNARRGTLSGAQSMFSRSSANRAKLDALFPNAGDVFDMLNGEASMRSTENVVRANSQTAANRAVAEKYGVAPPSAVGAAAPILGEALGGGAGAAGLTVGNKILNAMHSQYQNALMGRLMRETAQGLSATGPQQSNILDAIERAYHGGATTNALAGVANTGGNVLARPFVPMLRPMLESNNRQNANVLSRP